MKRLLAISALVTLSACESNFAHPAHTTDSGFEQKIKTGKVSLAARAPDGTKLWAVRAPGTDRLVYFSSTGTTTSHSENCGKSCTRTVDDVVSAAQ